MAQFHLLLLPGAGKQSSLSRDLCLEITVCNNRALSGTFHSQAPGNLFYYLIFPPTSWKAANVLCSPWFPGPSSVTDQGLARHLLLVAARRWHHSTGMPLPNERNLSVPSGRMEPGSHLKEPKYQRRTEVSLGFFRVNACVPGLCRELSAEP